MGVLMQAFYWNCPGAEGRDFAWYPHIESQVEALAAAGFTALWLPPVSKAADWRSMGYDPYDYYDLGEFDQKGGTPTWFGTRVDLESLIAKAHGHGLSVYADLVLNHNNGADAQELNPLTGKQWWYQFNPKSGRFPRDWTSFHPSSHESWDEMVFDGMPDLCHRAPKVYMGLLDNTRWLIETIGFDGFRFDFVKGYGGWLIRAIQEFRYSKPDAPFAFKPFGVGECWDSDRKIEEWLDEANAWSDNPVTAFDFPLRYRLKDMCDAPGFSMRTLASGGTLTALRPQSSVTFVDNHDLLRTNDSGHPGIVNDKMLAYAYILTHEGYPSVFWMDYFNFGLGEPGWRSGIAALVEVHEKYAHGPTQILYVDDGLYIAQRDGLVVVLNNRPGAWNGAAVQTRFRNQTLKPAAWRGKDDAGVPMSKETDPAGRTDLWAPPRGYCVYVAD